MSTGPGSQFGKPPRDHVYITPRKRRLSEYEAVTCYTQPGPDAFDIEGWFTLGPGPEHRTAWRKELTRLAHPHWWDFRDPAQQWQRTYVRMQAEQERAIERATEDAASAGAFADVDPAWLTDVVAGHYRIWSFFEYALFRAFAVASREALSDTLGNVLCFQGFDHMRHAQAAVLYLMVLEENVEGFLDQGAKQRWLNDPVYQPMRALAERLMLSTDDWGELAVAVNLVVAPILSEMSMSQLVRRGGPHRGDSVTPFIVSTTERDRRRNLAWTEELVRMVTAEKVEAAAANREVVAGWIADWTPPVLEAARALRPVFEQARVDVVSFDNALAAALQAQGEVVGALGLSPATVGWAPTMISGPRSKVALGLMKSEEADVTIEVMEAKYPDVQVHDFGTYWKIEGEGELRVEMDEISEALGRPLQLSQWLVIMATFVGRAHAGGDYFLVTSEMSYLEGDEAEASGPAAG